MSRRRILIYRSGAIGDAIVSLPAMQTIRQAFPDAHFILMTAGGAGGVVWTDRVLQEFHWFSDVVIYNMRDLRDPRTFWRLLGRLRALSVDQVFYLGSERNSGAKILRDRLFFRLAGIKRFIATQSDSVTFWGRLRKAPRIYLRETDRLLRELEGHGLPTTEVVFGLPIGDEQRRTVDRFLTEQKWDSERPILAICPGAKQGINVWPEERYAELGRRAIVDGGVNVVVIGGPSELEIGDRLVAQWPAGRAVNLARKLSILETAELVRRCDLYIGNDTGPMHIAASVGTRCITIMTARQPARLWHPYGEHNIVLRKSVPCQNCYLSQCVTLNRRCLLDITAEEVWMACRRALVYR